MTDARLDGLQVEALVLPDAPARQLDGLQVETLVQSDNVQRVLDGLQVETLVQSDNVQRVLDGFMVEVLIPVVPSNPVPWGVVSVGGAQDNPIVVLHPDGVWRVVRSKSQG